MPALVGACGEGRGPGRQAPPAGAPTGTRPPRPPQSDPTPPPACATMAPPPPLRPPRTSTGSLSGMRLARSASLTPSASGRAAGTQFMRLSACAGAASICGRQAGATDSAEPPARRQRAAQQRAGGGGRRHAGAALACGRGGIAASPTLVNTLLGAGRSRCVHTLGAPPLEPSVDVAAALQARPPGCAYSSPTCHTPCSTLPTPAGCSSRCAHQKGVVRLAQLYRSRALASLLASLLILHQHSMLFRAFFIRGWQRGCSLTSACRLCCWPPTAWRCSGRRGAALYRRPRHLPAPLTPGGAPRTSPRWP